MFTAADIRTEAYHTTYRRGKDLFEMGAVSDFSYDIYLEGESAKAEVCASVRGSVRSSYQVRLEVDESFSEVASSSCTCDAYFNYEGICKHCVAVLLAYVNRRQAREILEMKRGKALKDDDNYITPIKTASVLKDLLGQYSMRAGSAFLIPQDIYGRISLEPHFKMDYSYGTVEFKIGAEMKYVLKNIASFVQAYQKRERVRYGKKLDFYHCREAFTEEALRIVDFLQQQESDKKRQSQHRAFYVYSGGYERTMELDEIGLDRFFAAVSECEFYAAVAYRGEELYYMTRNERKPQLLVRAGSAGVFLTQENLFTMRGRERYYFCEGNLIAPSVLKLRGELYEFYDYMQRQPGNECYLAAEELPMFCRDLLPLLRDGYEVLADGFDESLYVPKKPEFELYLDKLEGDVVGAKLLSVYGEKKYNMLSEMQPGEMRDISEEFRIRSLVEPYFNEYSLDRTVLVLSRNEEKLYQLLSSGLQRLAEYMTIYMSEHFRTIKVVPSPVVNVGVSLKSDLLELTIHTKEMKADELAYLLSKYDPRKKYIRLKNGDFLDVQEDGLNLLAEVGSDLQLSEKQLRKGNIVVPKYRAMYLDAALKNAKALAIDKNRDFKSMVRNMKTIEDSDYEVPPSLKEIMRGYQKTGFLWLKTLRENGFGGILADDMGLGKTLQVISLLLGEYQEAQERGTGSRRVLIVCPASLVYNWKKEIERFAPQLAPVIVNGTAAERDQILRESREGDILITSYDTLKRDEEHYEGMAFSVQVIDEAQYIKNPGTQASKAVKKIQASFKLALTGTPIENRLSELWSIFDYLMPGFLYSYKRFREEMELPIVTNRDENKMERLQRMIRPFVLRRMKGDVLKDLPDKIEENVFARLEGEQISLYDAHVQRMKQMLEEKSDQEFRSQKIQILAELTRLRQICCDPTLLYDNYEGGSAKTEMCMELLQNAVTSGHKVLLFSQFTTMLDRLAERMRALEIPYYMLTGAVSKEKRAKMVEDFNRDDVPVFCISLKAGGTGLNLTAADIVIHYDPWWNVAVQNQATDRAHRIGQKHIVTVYKLVSQGTIEEKIIAIQERKKELAQQVLEGDGMAEAGFSREEILALLG